MALNYYDLLEKLSKEAKEVSNQLQQIQKEMVSVNWSNDLKTVNRSELKETVFDYMINGAGNNRGFY
ncbi:hypothetical protein RH915_04385 [Serpentinicella sp. ANB-PHB4]|uniref:hypothetical protein n=1 Tax=Serpentinicella sp. ANB-PHB4 TaxID=3074076 RepID=UPI00285F2F2A|nr:hypothetical protein [Serpentinicella sp. ANB-PHB4]MDR5658720.1 hypothetical protein [Serpentinicella sp. ANB-PHB4]